MKTVLLFSYLFSIKIHQPIHKIKSGEDLFYQETLKRSSGRCINNFLFPGKFIGTVCLRSDLTNAKSSVSYYQRQGNTGNPKEENMSRIRNKDIAEIVGVSRAAVTQVLNGSRPGCVSEAKRKAILKIAEEHNYHPDFAAQVLGSGKTRTIGMPLPWMQTLSSSFSYGRLLNYLTAKLEQKGYMLTLLPVANESSEKIHQGIDVLLRSRRVDGIVVNLHFLNQELGKTIQENKIPVVSFSFSSDQKKVYPEISNVGFDCQFALQELISRFTAFGKTAVIALEGTDNTRMSILHSYPELTFFELKKTPYFLNNTAAAAMVFIHQKWQELKNYPCWILQNDNFAYAADCVIREMGLIPGRDILFAGFDNMEENFANPFYTTVRDPFDEMADACIRLLWEQLGSGKNQAEHIKIPSRVIYRASSQPANPNEF